MMGGNPPAGSAVTCLVPTHNRANFLRRWFHFYRQFPPGFQVLVADSSRPDAAAENRKIVADQAGRISATILHLDLNLIGKILRALESVETPFVNLCADDDLILPEAVRRSADFLAANSGYVSAQGRTAKIYPRRRWFGCERLKGYSIEDAEALDRCRRLAGNFFTNFYAVYRTETLRELFRLTAEHTDSTVTYALAEMLLSQLSAARGRLKVLPCMHLLLERHPAMAGVQCRGQVWEDVLAQYARFRACLVAELVRAGTAPEAAGAYVDEQYVHYRDPNLLHRHRRRTPAEQLRHWSRSARERFEDHFHPVDVRHKRPVGALDIAGAETQWQAAVALMRAHPDGLPA